MPASTFKPVKYATLTLKQIVWRFRDVEEVPEGLEKKVKVTTPGDMMKFSFMFEDRTNERFVVFILNSNNIVQAVDIVTEGTLNASLVHPREVFRSAILGAGAAIIVAHNHPSGNTEPSSEDLNITRQLVESGKLLGIPVHDHIIFAGYSYTSFAERGLL